MTCETWMNQLDDYLDNELPDAEMEEFHMHLKGCDNCKMHYDLHMEIERSLKPEEGFTRRVMARIEADPLFGVEREPRRSIVETLRLWGYFFIAFLFILSIRNLFFGNVEWLSGLYITGQVFRGLMGGALFNSILTYTFLLPRTVFEFIRSQFGPFTPQGVVLYSIVLTNLILLFGMTQVFLRRLAHKSTTGSTKGGRE